MDAANPPVESVRRANAAVARVAAVVVTWNRKAEMERCLRAIAGQTYPASRLDVVVVDNASTDGTAEHVLSVWRPERAMQNTATSSDRPGFALGKGTTGGNAGGWRSLVLVRNQNNLGGCGGFNTGFLIVERMIAAHRAESMVPEDPRLARAEPLEFVWLIDDDAEPAADCLEKLVAAAQTDPTIGIVGSRMVDPTDRTTTLESTVFFNRSTGMFGAPEAGHPRHAEHQAWRAEVGSAKGAGNVARAGGAPIAQRSDRRREGEGVGLSSPTFAGLRDVDCVAACSMLARWGQAREVGYWDARFFIAGDDADWCLRFQQAGQRVVCCLDAVVYHLPWVRKQTVMQDYYRRRNLLWTWQRVLPEADLRRLAKGRVRLILKQAWAACWAGRGLDAEILRRTALDAATGRGGRLDLSHRKDAAWRDLGEVLGEVVGAAGSRARIAVVCPSPRVVRKALRVRARLRREGRGPAEWILVTPNGTVSERLAARLGRETDVRVLTYAGRLRLKIRRQMGLVFKPPAAWMVIDGRTDVPLVRPGRVVHVETRGEKARLERIVPGARLAFAGKWVWTWARCRAYLMRLKPRKFGGKFGTAPAAKEPAHR